MSAPNSHTTHELLRALNARLHKVDSSIAVQALGNKLLNELHHAALQSETGTPRDAGDELWKALTMLTNGSAYDLTDSPKSFLGNVKRLLTEYAALKNAAPQVGRAGEGSLTTRAPDVGEHPPADAAPTVAEYFGVAAPNTTNKETP